MLQPTGSAGGRVTDGSPQVGPGSFRIGSHVRSDRGSGALSSFCRGAPAPGFSSVAIRSSPRRSRSIISACASGSGRAIEAATGVVGGCLAKRALSSLRRRMAAPQPGAGSDQDRILSSLGVRGRAREYAGGTRFRADCQYVRRCVRRPGGKHSRRCRWAVRPAGDPGGRKHRAFLTAGRGRYCYCHLK